MNSNKSSRLDCADPKTPQELKLTALCDLWLRAAFVPEKREVIKCPTSRGFQGGLGNSRPVSLIEVIGTV